MENRNIYQVKLNKTFEISRVFALGSIVSAHVGITSELNGIIPLIYSYLSTLGVVTFLVMSGYFFNSEKYASRFDFFKNKAKTIVIPWFFLGMVAYFYKIIISGRDFTIIELTKWVLGNGTYLYYLTVLILCYFIFFRLSKTKVYFAILISIFSIILTAFDVLSTVITHLGITNYLNIFNWVGFFAIGILLKEMVPKKLFIILNKSIISISVIFTIITILFLNLDIRLGYFTILGPIYELLGTWMLLSISTIDIFDTLLFVIISKYSFTIYLIHMVIIGILNDYYNKFDITMIFSFIIVILVSTMLIYIGEIISRAIKLEKYYYLLTGIRRTKRD